MIAVVIIASRRGEVGNESRYGCPRGGQERTKPCAVEAQGFGNSRFRRCIFAAALSNNRVLILHRAIACRKSAQHLEQKSQLFDKAFRCSNALTFGQRTLGGWQRPLGVEHPTLAVGGFDDRHQLGHVVYFEVHGVPFHLRPLAGLVGGVHGEVAQQNRFGQAARVVREV